MTPERALTRLFTSAEVSEDTFTPEFTQKVPIAKLRELVASLKAQLGVFQGVEATRDGLEVAFARGKLSAAVRLDEQGRFGGLKLQAVARKVASMEDALEAYRALGERVGVLVTDGAGASLGGVEPDAPLAVGSTFKLALLAALRDQIDAKRRSWRDVVELREADRSLPSGLLQEWPAGAPLTLYALAALMVSRSDNTATDALIDLVGRAAAEAHAPRNRPYLTTRELFTLKAPGNEAILASYREGGEGAKRAILTGLRALPLPRAEAYPTAPTALDVEWFFSPKELCALMARVRDLPFMGINPGVADRAEWDRVAYKGGSEPGVLSMVTWLEKGPKRYCVASIWNGPKPADEIAFTFASQGLFHYLRGLP